MSTILYGIVGPTACRKTEVAIAVAKRVDAEIISADSVQVYRGMDIGSAKPSLVERGGVMHHMLDVADIDTPAFSVSMYREASFTCIDDVISRGKTPLLAGGSGLYISALTQPLSFAVPADPEIRREISEEFDRSPETVIDALRACDPVTAARLHPNDKKRIVRAMEVYRCSGMPLSSFGSGFSAAPAEPARYPSKLFGLTMDRARLYERIERRVDDMMERGLLAEARTIYERGYDRSLPAMQSIGYRQLFMYFDGACTLEEAVSNIKMETRRYAKRQYTWFRRDPNLVWLDVEESGEAAAEQISRIILEEK